MTEQRDIEQRDTETPNTDGGRANMANKTKIKTHKGTKKRFRLSAKGKAMHRQSGTSHLARGLSKKRRRNLRGTAPVAECMEPTIHAALNGHSY